MAPAAEILRGQTFSSAFNFAPTAGYKVIDVIITVLNLERGPEFCLVIFEQKFICSAGLSASEANRFAYD